MENIRRGFANLQERNDLLEQQQNQMTQHSETEGSMATSYHTAMSASFEMARAFDGRYSPPRDEYQVGGVGGGDSSSESVGDDIDGRCLGFEIDPNGSIDVHYMGLTSTPKKAGNNKGGSGDRLNSGAFLADGPISSSSSEANTPVRSARYSNGSSSNNWAVNGFGNTSIATLNGSKMSNKMDTSGPFSPTPFQYNTNNDIGFNNGYTKPISIPNVRTVVNDQSLINLGSNYGTGFNNNIGQQQPTVIRQPFGPSLVSGRRSTTGGGQSPAFNFASRNVVDVDVLMSQISNIQLAEHGISTYGEESLVSHRPPPNVTPLNKKEFLYALIISQLVADNHLDIATTLAQTKQLLAFRCLPTAHLQTVVGSYIDVIRTVIDGPPGGLAKLNDPIYSLDTKIIKFYLDSGKVKRNFPTSPTSSGCGNVEIASPLQQIRSMGIDNNVSISPTVANIGDLLSDSIMQTATTAGSFMKKADRELRVFSKFGALGASRSDMNMPHGFCIGVNDDIVIADTNNHRISIYELNGEHIFSFGEEGIADGKLYQPRKIALLPPGPRETEPVFVICDRGSKRSRMQIFSLVGKFIRVIDIPYIDIVSGLTTTSDGKIVIVDSVKSAVSVLLADGTTLNWFICGSMMNEPSDIAVHRNEFYICDFKGNAVMVFNQHGKLLRTIGSEYTKFPNGIDISDNGDVMVGDSHGNRFHVTLFNDQGQYIGDYECPTLKVSRCCGLKITKNGFIVTLAKNNHHALVLTPIFL